ncbi:mitochondrial iron-sulfur cluster biosynthesis Jac1 (co-chaperone HscB) [Andalucia godoyi]|uniref:Mitochondrial iron-sulfur cluster biosynthesis Jac1 (Co-chaperone HscB) n=1 Tax=Andalucia godoyi TaxID=505711 RepID=A0A8K0F4H6_ANDGO|nr:mitochondrial iron-sulfur cluster biosynthesis Jac1 (co-chaperone HscB) [Andalucia godoyi]|eukprot:ANDGO_03543.mRNA.1 mitochondrial iron-sulfur cluster biosynthesis Jac1 (co-chaperone HscB)
MFRGNVWCLRSLRMVMASSVRKTLQDSRCVFSMMKTPSVFARMHSTLHVRAHRIPISRMCWNCKAYLLPNELICASCSAVQSPPASIDYFSLFSIPQTLKINVPELDKTFKRMQRLLHPDKHTAAAAGGGSRGGGGHSSAETKTSQTNLENANQASSFVNEAYGALRDPVSRMHYLLMINGSAVSEETMGRSLDQDFLMEMMDCMENAAVSRVGSAEFHELQNSVEFQIEELYVNCAEAVEVRDWPKAQSLAMKINYWNRVRTILEEKIEEHEKLEARTKRLKDAKEREMENEQQLRKS